MKRWQLQEAKARLSELVASARRGPQEITVRGRAAVVVLSRADYEALAGTGAPLVEFLRASPLRGVDLELERDRSLTRPADL